MPLRTFSRDTTLLADDELGEVLVELVREAVARDAAPPVATVTRPDRIDVIGLAPIVQRGIPVHGFLASLATATVDPGVGDARVLGLMGTLQVRSAPGTERTPMAVVFLEWPDCRWWLWRALVDPATGTVRADTETRTRAVDGDPMPRGLGRWWSLARRRPFRVTIRQGEPIEPPPSEAPLVH